MVTPRRVESGDRLDTRVSTARRKRDRIPPTLIVLDRPCHRSVSRVCATSVPRQATLGAHSVQDVRYLCGQTRANLEHSIIPGVFLEFTEISR